MTPDTRGPLNGLRVVELAGIGPAPFCCMLLADMDAEVLRVDRIEPADIGIRMPPELQPLNRGRRSIAVDLKQSEGAAVVRKLVREADVLVEGFRPGVAERLGLGPRDCHAVNPRLVYGRMTGWGQTGPLAQTVGHDINYIALTGALDAIGMRNGPPIPPLNLVGDFGGGALYLAFGILCALTEVRQSGKGQVVDAAIVDGAASLMSSAFGAMARGEWRAERGEHMLGGAAPWYGVYETRDGKYVSIGSVEPRFYRELMKKTGIGEEFGGAQHDRARWPAMRDRLAEVFKTRTRDEWSRVLERSEVCFAPVLTADEARLHPHMAARHTFIDSYGIVQPAPAPRFDRSTPCVRRPPPSPGEHTEEILREHSFTSEEIARLRGAGVVR